MPLRWMTGAADNHGVDGCEISGQDDERGINCKAGDGRGVEGSRFDG